MSTYPTLSVTPERTDGTTPDMSDVGYFNDMDTARRYSEFLLIDLGYVSTVIEGTGWNGDPEDETTPTTPNLTLVQGATA